MASCMCSLLFIIFVLVSASAVDPAALKIRITNHALNMLRDEARDMFQEQVAETTFNFQFLNCKISNLRVTDVNVNQAHLRLVENYGFQFVIENFGFTLNFDSTLNLCFFQYEKSLAFGMVGVTATMEVGLTRNKDRRPAADMRTCQASADRMEIIGPGTSKNLEEKAQGILPYFISKVFCIALSTGGPYLVNRILNTIPMAAMVYPDAGISFDYSLTRDIRVTTTTLDMSFKGQAYRQPQPPPVGGDAVEPVFTEDALMAYVGISEFFFNSAARSLYEAGMTEKKFSKINWAAKALLRIKQFFTQPWNLREALKANVELTEAPTISITQQDGFIFNMRVKVAVISTGSGTPTAVFSLSAVCPIRIKVTVQGTRLTLPSGDVSCQLQTSNAFRKFLVAPLNSLLNNKATEFLTGWFGDGVEIPFPESVNFIQGNIQYQNGFVVVGGDLRFTPAGRQQLVNKLISFGR